MLTGSKVFMATLLETATAGHEEPREMFASLHATTEGAIDALKGAWAADANSLHHSRMLELIPAPPLPDKIEDWQRGDGDFWSHDYVGDPFTYTAIVQEWTIEP